MSSLTFSEGTQTQTILISIVEDMVYEGDESFTIVLSNPQPDGVVIGINTISITITDNDDQCKCSKNLHLCILLNPSLYMYIMLQL